MAGIEKTKTSTPSSTPKKTTPTKSAPKTSTSKPAQKPVKDSATLSFEKKGKAPAGVEAGLKDTFSKPATKAVEARAEKAGADQAKAAQPVQADPRNNVGEVGGLSISTGALAKGNLSGSPVDSQVVVKAMGDNNALGKGGAQQFDPFKFQGLVSSNPADAFTGSGATGKNVLDRKMPVSDMLSLKRYQTAETDRKTLGKERDKVDFARTPKGLSESQTKRFDEMRENRSKQLTGNINMNKETMNKLDPTYKSYQNPLSGSADEKVNNPEKRWDAGTRENQAKLMMQQPINSLHKGAYGDKIPTRSEVIDAAAKKNNLDPKVLGGILLQEQRDQSRKEDAADIGGARLGGGSTSIGLGQINMDTAMKNKNDLFADTIPDAKVRENLHRDEVAKLLTSDDHNIFAAARYMRGSADKGLSLGSEGGGLSNIKDRYPGFDPKSLSGSKWNADTVKAIAGDYSANSFGPNRAMNAGYPEFVGLAVEDISRAGIFK